MHGIKLHFATLLTNWLIFNIGLVHGEIYIPSRGRSGSIHQFYDQRIQALRPYMLTDMDHSMANIVNNPRGGSTLKRTVTKTYSEYVEKLEIGGEAKLDLLLNIFEGGIGGKASVTKVERQSSTSVFAFVEILQYTREEKTDLCDPKWLRHFQFPFLYSEHLQATHIIKGKLYGLYLEIILEIHESEGESNSILQIDVQAELDSFLARIDVSSSGNKIMLSKNYLSKSKILTYCNLINCPTPPQNLDQLEQFIKNSIATLTLNPDTQGNEISLVADDIKSLTECWNITVSNLNNKTKSHELSGENVNKIESVIRETEEGVASIYTFLRKIENFKECIPEYVMADIQLSANEAMSFANTFKAKLKKFVIYIRFGKRDQGKMNKKIKMFRSNLKNPINTLQTLNLKYFDWLEKAKFYASIIKAEMYCLPAKLNLLTMFENSRHETQLFYLMGNKTLQDNDQFIETLPMFANICSNKFYNCTCYIADCFHGFSFCKSYEPNQIVAYNNGILAKANNSTNVVVNSGDYGKIQQAILYMYIHDSKTMKALYLLNEKIDAYYSETRELVDSKRKVSITSKEFNNLTSLFDHDSLDRNKKQRKVKNPVENLLQEFIDLGH